MRKEAEEAESPKRSIRDSGYIDCWDSERSDSLSPPRHGREDSFDSLDSFGSQSRQTPSPDVLVARGSSDGRGSDSESDGPPHRKMPDVRKDDMLARRTSVSEPRSAMPFNQYLPNRSNQSGYVPTPLRKKKSDKEEGGRKSWSTATSPIGGDRPFSVSDDSQSMSMIDMRGEEEAAVQAHSQVRHELMHNQYNQMKEEDHWQEDLARWKSRRRSISQDLIKKEEERKTMERLMSGDTSTSQRRRSIKTYREIVEDKERREEELREAYKKARTPEEASVILQRYAQRFSISEAVLERLQLPKLLDRSISADPSFPGSPFPLSLSLSSSPTTPDPFDMDPNGPMRFLRQLSAPAPKFTSTLEARIEEFPKDSSSHQRPQIHSHSSEPPSTRALSPKPVPLLTPKPYFQSQPTSPSKMDGLLRVNGDIGSHEAPFIPESRGRESPPHFQASPSITNTSTVDAPSPAVSPPHSPHTSTGGESPVVTKAKEVQSGTKAASDSIQEEKVTENSPPPSRPTSLPGVRMRSWFFPLLPQARRGDRWSWDPDEERKRQERWQQEQERVLQEKYRREQEKLKEEWERAQREVAEEERKYHEEVFSVFLLSLPCRSVSGKKLCSSCGQPLGKGAAMIIETLSLYFHIHCFKCGVCKGQLGDTTTGTDVRIRNGLLNCHQCYIRSRSAGQPTTL
uniref:LIM and calponin homology domains 1 n=1 Tax=Mastacembelus armatus TaxID=205130 RepID=A0A7N8YBI5_9TELE